MEPEPRSNATLQSFAHWLDRLITPAPTVGRKVFTLNMRRMGIASVTFAFCRPVGKAQLRRMREVEQSRVWLSVHAHYYRPGNPPKRIGRTYYWHRMWKQSRAEF